MRKYLLTTFVFLSCVAFGQTKTLVVNADKPIAAVQPTMWGIFFEDINFAADGGINAELIKNRSFEFDQPLMGWEQKKTDRFSSNKESGSALIINRGGASTNKRFARIETFSDKGYVLSNTGFRGIGVKKGVDYLFSLAASHLEGTTRLRIELVSSTGSTLAEATLEIGEKEWKKYSATLRPTQTDARASFNLWFEGVGVTDIDVVSLFPSDTWKGRPNGLRADLVQLLADMKPGFLRFPGGCIVEGRELDTRYQWKKTVGDVDSRELIINRWNTEFNHRPAPDYFQSFGLGFYEYFLLAEDIGAEPLPILNCGMACQFNTAEVVPLDELDPYIQDALDLIEFANGGADTRWGKLRSEMGHPAPFNLKMIGIGNEQWGPQYFERYEAFHKAIKAKYPEIKIVSGTGPFADGEMFDVANKTLLKAGAEIIDEHYYRTPDWFLKNAGRYDGYDRKGPKIFAGEYAAQSVATVSPDNKNNWQCALAEAAFMTGLERNAEVVTMCSYAPLFAHVDGWQWTPDLIWFDNLSSFGTANYHVQKMYSVNKGSKVVPLLMEGKSISGQEGLHGSAVMDDKDKSVVVKLVNASGTAQSLDFRLQGHKARSATISTLTAGSLTDYNTIEKPELIKPEETTVSMSGRGLKYTLASNSFVVIRMK